MAQEPRRPNPPPAFIQSLLMLILRSPLHGLLSKSLLLISFQGRKSGRRYEIPVAYVEDGDALLIASQAGWWRNLVGGAPVSVQLRGRRRGAVATAAATTDERRAGLSQVLRGANRVADFMQVQLGPDGEPDPQQIAGAVERGWTVVRVVLT